MIAELQVVCNSNPFAKPFRGQSEPARPSALQRQANFSKMENLAACMSNGPFNPGGDN